MSDVALQFTGDEQKVENALRKMALRVDDLNAKIKQLNAAAREAGKSNENVFTKGASALASYALGLVGIQQIWSAIVGSQQQSLEVLREMSTESSKAAKEMVNLALLQTSGDIRGNVESAAALARTYGITDRGAAFDVVQSLQSAAGGNFKKGMQAAAEVFAASLTGIPLAIGQQVEAKGAALGAQPGTFLRMTQVAGQLSAATPADIGKGISGIPFFDDPKLGFAAASVLVDLYGGELDTYLKGAGRAIGATVPKGLERWLKRRGMAGADQMSILGALHEAGIDTPKEFAGLGVTEIREMQGLATLTANFPRLVENYQKVVAGAADTNLFGREFTRLSGELPNLEEARKRDQLIAMAKDTSIMEPGALREENSLRVMGVALRRIGMTKMGPFRLVDQEGMPSAMAPELLGLIGGAQAFGRDVLGGRGGVTGFTYGMLQPGEKTVLERLEKAMNEVVSEMRGVNSELKRQTRSIERPSGPLMSSPLLNIDALIGNSVVPAL